MKLKVIIGQTSVGGKVAYLADENGQILPGQTDTKLECLFLQKPKFTVTFQVGGLVELVDSRPVGGEQG